MLKFIINIVMGVLLAIPLVLYPLLYFTQDNLIFHPRPIEAATLTWAKTQFPQSEWAEKTPDGTLLKGWWVMPENKTDTPQKHPVLVFFGGNSEETTEFLEHREKLPDHAWIVVNYRGFGASAGKPSEDNLLKDAAWLWSKIAADPRLNIDRVILMGRSLGTGVATALASQHPKVQGVILVSPYTSLVDIAQRTYPYAPVSWLLKHRFDSLQRAPQIKVPVLAFIGAEDDLIPPSNSQTLLDAWAGKTQVEIVAGADHVSISHAVDFWSTIQAFVMK